ncbi:MAG: sulfotransferase, partial [Candidatus Ferrigenium altingense]
DFAEAHCNLGFALKEQGELEAAIESCRRALALKPDFAEAYNTLGSALKDQPGKLVEVVESFRKALSLRPDFAEAHNNLGKALHDQGKLEAAVGSFHKALLLRPDLAEAHSNLGNALQEQGDSDAAVESFRKALSLKPDCAEAHIGLAGVCLDAGQFAEAKTHLDRALALKPDHPGAWAWLPSLRKMTLDDLPWAEKAQHLLEGGLKAQEEVELCYALGKYHDDTRRYEAAFACYERANRLKRRFDGHFDRDAFRRFVDTIISAHTPATMQQLTGGNASHRPLFIVGMPRSGTSLTEQILASHPDVFGAGELRFWGQQANLHASSISSWHRDATLLRDIASQYEAELQRHSAAALRVVDKMPGNFMHLGLIHAVFPQARILHTRRNPVDTCLSIYFQGFSNQHIYANDLDDLAFYYREYHRLMEHWRAVLPPEVFLDVPYEGLVEDQEDWSRKIIGFIGLEWDERCLNFHETERMVGTASNWQVRQKIYKTSRERWRNYEKFVMPLLPLLELAG